MLKQLLKPYIDGYKNIGKTIKEWAIASAILEAIGAVITGIVFLCDLGIEDGWWALLIIWLGPVAAWVMSLFPYAFGELVEDIHAMRNKEGITEGDEVKESKDDMQAEEKFIADINEEEKLTPLTVKTTIDTPKTEEKEYADISTFTTTENGTIVCSQCKFEQPNNRRVCWHCGAKFENE